MQSFAIVFVFGFMYAYSTYIMNFVNVIYSSSVPYDARHVRCDELRDFPL